MSTTVNARNGIDVARLVETVEAISSDPNLAAFTFRARSSWRDGDPQHRRNRRVCHGGQEDQSRAAAFVLEGDEPPVLLGNNSGPNAVGLLLQALAFSCAVGYVANAAARGIEITRMDYEIELRRPAISGSGRASPPDLPPSAQQAWCRAPTPRPTSSSSCAATCRTHRVCATAWPTRFPSRPPSRLRSLPAGAIGAARGMEER